MPGAYLWGFDMPNWREVVVDAAGHLQVDVLSGVGVASQCYGWIGDVWYHLLVESAANANLRVRLYDGANKITAGPLNQTPLTTDIARGHDVRAIPYLFVAANRSDVLVSAFFNPDDTTGTNTAAVGLWGFTGTRWWKIRTWSGGILKVGRAEIDSTTLRKTVAGAVVAGVRKLFWISCSPDAPGAEFELTDATEALQAIVFDHFDPDKHSEMINFDPPMKFANGIWIEKFDHMHSLIFCYS